MSAHDDLKLAWYADRDGRPGRRDVLLTLALAASTPDDADWPALLYQGLIDRHPDHLFARFKRLEAALGDPDVRAALMRLRLSYPPGRVRWLLQRQEAGRGPFLDRAEPFEAMLEDLLDLPLVRSTRRQARRDAPSSSRPLSRPTAQPATHQPVTSSSRRRAPAAPHVPSIPARPFAPEPMMPAPGPPRREFTPEPAQARLAPDVENELLTFYLTVLLALAALLSYVLGRNADRAA